MKSRAFEALLKASAETGLPKAFKADLTTHDRKALQELGDLVPFLWGVRECGTHLIRLDLPTKPEEYSPLRIVEMTNRMLGYTRWFHWNELDGRLSEVPNGYEMEMICERAERRARQIEESKRARAVAQGLEA